MEFVVVVVVVIPFYFIVCLFFAFAYVYVFVCMGLHYLCLFSCVYFQVCVFRMRVRVYVLTYERVFVRINKPACKCMCPDACLSTATGAVRCSNGLTTIRLIAQIYDMLNLYMSNNGID